MKVCVLYAAKSSNNTYIKKIATAVAKGIEQQNHIVDVIDMKLEQGKVVSYYDYLIVGAEGTKTFGGSVPKVVQNFLDKSGSISGKRCMAFVCKPGIRSTKTLQALMKVMEAQGMYLKTSDIIKNEQQAIAIGKRIHIK
ncbi:MAG: flavodoxin family protein [Pleomorphochaeta sp.]